MSLGILGDDKEVDIAAIVEVGENCRRDLFDPCFHAGCISNVGKCPVTVVPVQMATTASRLAEVGPRETWRSRLGCLLGVNVVPDVNIQITVVVHVGHSCRQMPMTVAGNPRLHADVTKRAIAVVLIEPVCPILSQKKIGLAIIVQSRPSRPPSSSRHPEYRISRSRR